MKGLIYRQHQQWLACREFALTAERRFKDYVASKDVAGLRALIAEGKDLAKASLASAIDERHRDFFETFTGILTTFEKAARGAIRNAMQPTKELERVQRWN